MSEITRSTDYQRDTAGRVRSIGYREEADQLLALMDKIIQDAADDGRATLLASEQRRFDEHKGRLDALEPMLEREHAEHVAEGQRQRAQEAARLDELASRMHPTRSATLTSPRDVYSPDGSRGSYFRDLFAVQRGDWDAAKRLADQTHARVGYARALNTTAGTGGEFAPPEWMEEQFIALARPGRVVADLFHREPLPTGVGTIDIPRIKTGTSVGVQGTQNTAISQTDLTTDAVSAPIITLAGGQTVSQQMIDMSPVNIDQLVLGDLAEDYSRELNSQTVAGTGTGQLTGVLNAGGAAITYTSTTPTLSALLSSVANAMQTIATTRYLPATAIVMHPRRWAWALAQLDTTNRPLIVPSASGPFNAIGTASAQWVAQGAVGQLAGLPVLLDSEIPTNLGTGTNQDAIVVGRFTDSWLFESSVRVGAFPETYANQLSVFVRLYNYAAVAHRYAGSYAVIGGTGLVAPTF